MHRALSIRKRALRIIKDWTLPVAMGIGTLAYLLFAYTPALEGAANFFAPVFDAILPLFMFLILFVTFCKIDFRKLQPVAWNWWVGLFQVLFVGLIMAVVLCFGLQAEPLILAEALLTIAVCPTAAAAAVVTQKLGGSLEQMTTYTFLSNFITAMLIPVCFPILEKSAEISFATAFLKISYGVCTVLLVPMLLAYIVKHFMQGLHRRIIGIKDLGYYMWACSLMIVTGTTVKNICHATTTAGFVLLIAFASLLICIAQFAVGRYVGRLFSHRVEAGQGLGQKNTAFAIWVAHAYLNPLSSVGPGCYILWQNIINSVEIWKHARNGSSSVSRKDG